MILLIIKNHRFMMLVGGIQFQGINLFTVKPKLLLLVSSSLTFIQWQEVWQLNFSNIIHDLDNYFQKYAFDNSRFFLLHIWQKNSANKIIEIKQSRGDINRQIICILKNKPVPYLTEWHYIHYQLRHLVKILLLKKSIFFHKKMQ